MSRSCDKALLHVHVRFITIINVYKTTKAFIKIFLIVVENVSDLYICRPMRRVIISSSRRISGYSVRRTLILILTSISFQPVNAQQTACVVGIGDKIRS